MASASPALGLDKDRADAILQSSLWDTWARQFRATSCQQLWSVVKGCYVGCTMPLAKFVVLLRSIHKWHSRGHRFDPG
jgi:hypothetical protein